LAVPVDRENSGSRGTPEYPYLSRLCQDSRQQQRNQENSGFAFRKSPVLQDWLKKKV
jgi:hypothetical protein